MKIKLISPARKPEWGKDFWDSPVITPGRAGVITLALPTLAALTPPDVEVILTDERIEAIDFKEKVDLVGISFLTTLAPRAYEIADKFRSRGVPVVLGGIHASMLPEEAVQHADAVVIGEAENTWAQLVQDLKNKKLQRFYKTSAFAELKNTPIPRWDLVKNDVYRHFTVQTARGCPYECEFCAVHAYLGRRYRHRQVDDVVKEIQMLIEIAGNKLLFFADDNLLSVPSYSRELFKALIPLKMKGWLCQASINRLGDDNILHLMRKAGCMAVIVGLESISEDSLGLMKKSRVNKVSNFKETIDKVHSNGIAVVGSFIFGNDTDNEASFSKTLKFIEDTNIAIALINIATPLPGTALFKRLEEGGRILHQNWEKFNGSYVVFKPNAFSGNFLQERTNWVGKQLYDYSAFYKRVKRTLGNKVFVEREKDSFISLFTKERFLLSLNSFFAGEAKRTSFMLKSLWNLKYPSIVPLVFGLRLHDYFYEGENESSSNFVG